MCNSTSIFLYFNTRETVDSWAIGCILMSIMTRRYPFFNQTSTVSDGEVLEQMACVFGSRAIEELAIKLGMYTCKL